MFFRYFSESIDDTVDPKTRKLAMEKLQSMVKEIKFSKDKMLDAVRSDIIMKYNPSQQKRQSHVEQMHMRSVASSSSLNIISVGTTLLPSMPSPLATIVIETCTSSETPSFVADNLQLSNKAESEGGGIEINEQQKIVCEPCLIINDNISTETEEQYTTSIRDLSEKLKENNSVVIHSGTECTAQNNKRCCIYSMREKTST